MHSGSLASRLPVFLLAQTNSSDPPIFHTVFLPSGVSQHPSIFSPLIQTTRSNIEAIQRTRDSSTHGIHRRLFTFSVPSESLFGLNSRQDHTRCLSIMQPPSEHGFTKHQFRLGQQQSMRTPNRAAAGRTPQKLERRAQSNARRPDTKVIPVGPLGSQRYAGRSAEALRSVSARERSAHGKPKPGRRRASEEARRPTSWSHVLWGEQATLCYQTWCFPLLITWKWMPD